MPNKVGRPRTYTDAGSAAPVNPLGVPDWGLGGYGAGVLGSPLQGISGSPWRMYVDELEYVPELRYPRNIWLYDQMRTDSQLAGLLTAVMWGICQLRFVVDPNGAKSKVTNELKKDLNLSLLGKDPEPVGRLKGRFSHSKFVSQALTAVIWGHYHFEMLGEIVNGLWRLRKLEPRPPHTLQQINVAENGDLISIRQWPGPSWIMNVPNAGLGPEIPIDRLFPVIFQQEGKSQTGRSMMRDCYKDWLLKDRNLRIEAINHERAGGVPYAVAPQGATDSQIHDLSEMMTQFRIGEEAGAALPFGSDLKIARGTGSDVDKTIKRLDESMARRFLLMLVNLAQGGQHVGSYALGETFEDFFIVGQRHIAQWYCDAFTEYVIENWVDWNFGSDEELTPRLTWERTSEDSLGTQEMALLVERGVITMDQELENWVRYRYMLPKKTEPRPEVSPGGPRQPWEQKAQIQPAQTGVEPGVTPSQQTAGAPPTQAAGAKARVLPPAEAPADTEGEDE